jgi:hypothetical protein
VPNVSTRGSEDDNAVLAALFTEVAQKISDDVTRLMQEDARLLSQLPTNVVALLPL